MPGPLSRCTKTRQAPSGVARGVANAISQQVHQDATGAYLVIGLLFDTANDATHQAMKGILDDFPMGKEEAPTLKTFNYTRALEYWIGADGK